jgi:hypothetical protein
MRCRNAGFAAAGLGTCLLAANLFAWTYVSSERFIYYWDLANYWDRFIRLTHLFEADPLSAIQKTVWSLQRDDYNFVPVVPFVPIGLLLGVDRPVYILCIVNLLALPAIITLHLLCRQAAPPPESNNESSGSHLFVPVLVALTTPQFWIPILRGFVDVGGAALINMALFLHFQTPIQKQSVKRLMGLGAILGGMVLFRRWYAFWAAAFLAALPLEAALTASPGRGARWETFMTSLKKVFLLGALSLAFVALPMGPKFLEMTRTDYVDQFTAYRQGTSLQSILRAPLHLATYFGTLPTLLFLSAFLYALYLPRTRRVSLFLGMQGIIALALFSRVHPLDPYNVYLLLPSMLFLLSISTIEALRRIERSVHRVAFISLVASIYIAGFSKVLLAPSQAGKIQELAAVPSLWFSRNQAPPLARNDLEEIGRLLATLDPLLKNPKETAYVLSSSRVLNDDILRHAHRIFQGSRDLGKQLPHTHHVDRRDGFPRALLTARYVVIGRPIQYHLAPEHQQAIGAPAEAILQHRHIGKSYVKLPYTFHLAEGVEAEIYERVETLRKEDIRTLLSSAKLTQAR